MAEPLFNLLQAFVNWIDRGAARFVNWIDRGAAQTEYEAYQRYLEEDYSKAAELYRKAAKLGVGTAQYALALMLYRGVGVAQDYAEAFKWCRKAARDDVTEAQSLLGEMYAKGRGVSQDLAKAAKWLRKAANKGFATAQKHLASMYYYGDFVTQDYALAAKWIQQAAEQDDIEAICALGKMYYDGQGVERDFAKAQNFLSKAADRQNVNSMNLLAWICATCPDPQFLDGPKAVNLAEGVCVKEPENHHFIDTLAGAYARTGQYDRAIELEIEALQLLRLDMGITPEIESKLHAKYERRLSLYQAHQPCVCAD